jgi:hypothetical protein
MCQATNFAVSIASPSTPSAEVKLCPSGMQAVDLRELKRSVTQECNVEVGLKEYKSFLGFRNGHTKKFMYENLRKFRRKRLCSRGTSDFPARNNTSSYIVVFRGLKIFRGNLLLSSAGNFEEECIMFLNNIFSHLPDYMVS